MSKWVINLTLILKDSKGKYFPVIDIDRASYSAPPHGLVWVTGVTKKILENELNIDVIEIRLISKYYQYTYLVSERQYLEYLATIEPPIVLESY